MSVKILDLRHEQVNPFPAKKKADGSTLITSKIVKGRTYERPVGDIDGITIHQTACVFGPSGDLDRRNRRALGIPAHAVAFRDGTVVLPAPLSWYLYHGNDLNRHTLGLEIEGRYPGLPDDPRTPKREDEAWGGGATPLDESTVQSARAALTRLVEEGRSLGMPLSVPGRRVRCRSAAATALPASIDSPRLRSASASRHNDTAGIESPP